MKKFLKFDITKWAMRGEASGCLEVWLLFLVFIVRSLALPLVAAGFGIHYMNGGLVLWA